MFICNSTLSHSEFINFSRCRITAVDFGIYISVSMKTQWMATECLIAIVHIRNIINTSDFGFRFFLPFSCRWIGTWLNRTGRQWEDACFRTECLIMIPYIKPRICTKKKKKKKLASRSIYHRLKRPYLFPLKAQTPQFPQETSCGSKSFRSHRKLRKMFSPGCSNISNSPAHCFWTQSMSLCMSQGVYPVHRMGTLVSNSEGSVSSHSWELAGWPRPGWKRTKQSKYGSKGWKYCAWYMLWK